MEAVNVETMNVKIGAGQFVFVILTIAIVTLLLAAFRSPKAAPPAAPGRLSALSVLAFLSGLFALLCMIAALILAETAAYRDLLGFYGPWNAAEIRLAAEILRHVSWLPVVGALGLGLAARGAVAESRGELRGLGLSGSALLAAGAVGALALTGF